MDPLHTDVGAELAGIDAKVIISEMANVDSAGNVNILGTGAIAVPSGPRQMFVTVMMRARAGQAGAHTFVLELVDASGEQLARTEGEFEIPEGKVHEDDEYLNSLPTSAMLQIAIRAELPERKYLEWRLWLDGNTHSSWRDGFYTL